ncbi:hypothetical protein GGI19_005854 [Coemansia pectinata]|uniref:Uncharacterized protein n=1 Tax=Coemansia pectinata TaxID=1052879 RepID=A0A9W8GV80_9FUNG|nr:hypothetical protein GGI19_005854 [Coemansia pectinata]
MALYKPAKRRLSSSDPFFAQGNAESVLHSIDKQLAVSVEDNAQPEELVADSHQIICHDAPCLGTVLFARPGKRRLHMIDKHKFPVNFNWALLRNGLLPIDHHPRRHHRQQQKSQKPLPVFDISEDMDVDSLATAFAGSVRVSAPKSISFGRRGGHR